MRQPAFTAGPRGAQTSVSDSIPAPTRGWNAREGKANMNALDALVLENWFPEASDVKIRKGCENYATGLPSSGQSLLPYTGTTTKKFFVASGTGIYDISSSGAIGASVTSVTNTRLESINFNTLGGSYLIAVNGTDKLKLYNGTTWTDIDGASTPAITGLATTSFTHVSTFKKRLWFTQKNSMSAWYLPVSSIGGVLSEFPVGQLFVRGGYLLGTATWTIDGGIGIDDHFVFLSSEGEIAVYKGTDPSSATDFNLVGVYFAGKPLGIRSFTKYGGDLLILCETGLVALSKLLAATNVNFDSSLSNRIEGAFANAVQLYGANVDWQCVVYPAANLAFMNIPIVANSRSDQFAMNSVTKAWCSFTGWNATTWAVWDGDLYFTTSNKVVKAWTGTSDYGNNIVASAKTAFNYFRARSRVKRFTLLRPILELDLQVKLELGIDVDFESGQMYNNILLDGTSSSIWDTSLWDSALWSASNYISKDWRTVEAKPGFAAAFRLRVSTKSASVSWSATDYVYRAGGIL